jgi:predicted DNA-binding ribbon-helix-helix protein
MVERVQNGVHLEKRVLKVLKAFADYRDLTLGDLLEGIRGSRKKTKGKKESRK